MNYIFSSRDRLKILGNVTALSIALTTPFLISFNPVLAQEQKMKTLTVSGRGIINIPTTLTQIRLGVEIKGKTATEVQQQVAQRSAAVVALLKSRNVEKLQTTGINLNPSYSYQNNVQRLEGYIAANTVSFRIDTKKAGNILDEAVKAGATRIDGISFIASDSAIAEARQQALRAATQDAQQQADTVLSALNLTRREIVNIQINSTSSPPPRQMLTKTVAFDAINGSSTPVEGGEQEIEASVTLQISY